MSDMVNGAGGKRSRFSFLLSVVLAAFNGGIWGGLLYLLLGTVQAPIAFMVGIAVFAATLLVLSLLFVAERRQSVGA